MELKFDPTEILEGAINTERKEYKRGAFKVKLDSVSIAINKDDYWHVSLKMTEVKSKLKIEIMRIFINQRVYNTSNARYDIIHNLFKIIGVNDTKSMMENDDWKTLQDRINENAGRELIILTSQECSGHNMIDHNKSVLDGAFYLNGLSVKESGMKNSEIDNLVFACRMLENKALDTCNSPELFYDSFKVMDFSMMLEDFNYEVKPFFS